MTEDAISFLERESKTQIKTPNNWTGEGEKINLTIFFCGMDFFSSDRERVSNEASWKHFCSSEKKWPTKADLDQNKINMEVILVFLMKQLFKYKMII